MKQNYQVNHRIDSIGINEQNVKNNPAKRLKQTTNYSCEVDAPPQQEKEAAKILNIRFLTVPEW